MSLSSLSSPLSPFFRGICLWPSITLADVEEVITRMGNPEEMEEEDNSCETSADADATGKDASAGAETRKVPRRFYRNPDDKMLGVFCSPLLFAAAIVLLVLLFAAMLVLFSGVEAFLGLFPLAHFTLPDAPMTAIVMYIALTLMLGIPLLGIVYSVFRPLFKWQRMPFGLKLTLILLWLFSTVTFFITFAMYGAEFPELLIQTHYI